MHESLAPKQSVRESSAPKASMSKHRPEIQVRLDPALSGLGFTLLQMFACACWVERLGWGIGVEGKSSGLWGLGTGDRGEG